MINISPKKILTHRQTHTHTLTYSDTHTILPIHPPPSISQSFPQLFESPLSSRNTATSTRSLEVQSLPYPTDQIIYKVFESEIEVFALPSLTIEVVPFSEV